MASRKRSVVWRPSIGCVVTTAAAVLPVAATCLAVVLASVAELIDEPSWVNVPVLVVIAPIAALVGCFLAHVSVAVAIRLVAPSRLDRDNHVVRVRVDRGWMRRTRATFAVSTLGPVWLKAWQRGTRQVWIEHESGAAMRVTDALMPSDAATERRRVRALLS